MAPKILFSALQLILLDQYLILEYFENYRCVRQELTATYRHFQHFIDFAMRNLSPHKQIKQKFIKGILNVILLWIRMRSLALCMFPALAAI